jgi:1,2-phenylacetyl-CoA epoxidase catalytic subunit
MAFRGGQNIALKVPLNRWEVTVAFYRDTVGLPQLQATEESVVFQYGSQQLWVDRCPHLETTEVWLEILTDNLEHAAQLLNTESVVRCDDVEPLSPGFRAFWIRNPAGLVTLIAEETN